MNKSKQENDQRDLEDLAYKYKLSGNVSPYEANLDKIHIQRRQFKSMTSRYGMMLMSGHTKHN